ncbi:MAG: hypothetical protein LBD45_00110, partial [Bacteroidales bacterium]|nr:hypothetical protein [Bacteroidales bacterium]
MQLDNKRSTGGYLQLELRETEHFHKEALRLNSGRNCLEYILLARKYQKVYIPYYTCNVVLEPFVRQGIRYEFYPIDEKFDPINILTLHPGEGFLYTNYFGLRQKTTEILAKIYGNQLIIDNSQAFYAKRLARIDTFYSARKFFGVPDGAYLYTDAELDMELPQAVSWNRMAHLLKRIDLSAEDGYDDFRENDNSLCNQPILKMSKLTDTLLKSIDYKQIKEKRLQNFFYLDSCLKTENELSFYLSDETVPLVYPFLHEKKINLKQTLIDNKIYVAT